MTTLDILITGLTEADKAMTETLNRKGWQPSRAHYEGARNIIQGAHEVLTNYVFIDHKSRAMEKVNRLIDDLIDLKDTDQDLFDTLMTTPQARDLRYWLNGNKDV